MIIFCMILPKEMANICLLWRQILHVSWEQQEKFSNRLQRHYVELSPINAKQGDAQVPQFINEVVWVAVNHSLPDI